MHVVMGRWYKSTVAALVATLLAAGTVVALGAAPARAESDCAPYCLAPWVMVDTGDSDGIFVRIPGRGAAEVSVSVSVIDTDQVMSQVQVDVTGTAARSWIMAVPRAGQDFEIKYKAPTAGKYRITVTPIVSVPPEDLLDDPEGDYAVFDVYDAIKTKTKLSAPKSIRLGTTGRLPVKVKKAPVGKVTIQARIPGVPMWVDLKTKRINKQGKALFTSTPKTSVTWRWVKFRVRYEAKVKGHTYYASSTSTVRKVRLYR